MNYFSDNNSLAFHLGHADMEAIATQQEQNFADCGRYAEAPADAREANQQYEDILTLIGQIAAETVAPNAAEADLQGPTLEAGEVRYAPATRQGLDALVRSGLYGFSLQRRYGGLNVPRVVAVMAAELLARADVGFATIWGLQDCADTVQEFGSDELKECYLPRIAQGATCSMDLTEPDAGSDLQSVRLSARYDEASGCWRLNGVKRFITNGGADLHLVLARSEEGSTDGRGLSYFLFDRAEGGLTVRRLENKMGIRCSPTAELQFSNAPAHLVGERRRGLIKYVMSLMNGARLGVAAQSVGLCEAACREAEAYAASRRQFGHSICEFVPVQDMLLAMRGRTDAARSLLYETARQVDLGRESRTAAKAADLLTPLVKLMASEFANTCAYDCIQVHGGSGYMKEYACERLYRDARILSIYEGTSQLQVVAAAKGIGTGAYTALLAGYDSRIVTALPNSDIAGELSQILNTLHAADARYEAHRAKAAAGGTLDHALRSLAEQAAYLIMGRLLILDCLRDSRFLTSCRYVVSCLSTE